MVNNFACLSFRLIVFNISQTAVPIGLKFWVDTPMTPGKIYFWKIKISQINRQ